MTHDFTRVVGLTLKVTKSEITVDVRFYEDSIFGQCCTEFLTFQGSNTEEEQGIEMGPHNVI